MARTPRENARHPQTNLSRLTRIRRRYWNKTNKTDKTDSTQTQNPKSYPPAFHRAVARLLGDEGGAVLCLAPLRQLSPPQVLGGSFGTGSSRQRESIAANSNQNLGEVFHP